MKSKFLSLLLGVLLVFTFAGNTWSGQGDEPYTIMHPDAETLQKWMNDFEKAPRAWIDPEVMIPRGAYSLLSHLDYVPSERNQGSCGNCWAWAGTGVMEVALDVEENVFDRLSIQYLNSCKTDVYACCGANLTDVATYYTGTGQAIPWSNTNASYQDASQNCSAGSSLVPCGSISTSPNYPIDSLTEQTIPTQGIGQETAIANIKNILLQNKAIYFSYYLVNSVDWNNFFNFWTDDAENVTWNPDFSCGHSWVENEGGGHAVLCVGYNDDDPNNRYWIMVNSWGTEGGRPNGIFHLDMNMDYDCWFYYPPTGQYFYSFYWQTLDTDYTPVPQPDLVVLSIETEPVEPDAGETVNVTVTVKNEASVAASGFRIDWYADLGLPPSPSQVGDEYESVSSLAAGASHTMSTTYSYGAAGIYNMYAQVDTNQDVTESNEDNNVLGPVSIVVRSGDYCECDLNHDGRCDMQDWLIFGEDWGRTDCPIP